MSDEGRVEWGQQVAGAPYEVKKEHSHEYVTGTFLLAGSEMLKLAKPPTCARAATVGELSTSRVEREPRDERPVANDR